MRLKDIQEQLDLKKRFPNYFNKWVFRGVIIIMVLFTITLYISEGGYKFVYAECDKDVPCNNPFYACHGYEFEGCMSTYNIPKEIKPLCDAGYCENKTLMPHQVIGDKPSFWVLNYNLICLLLVVLGFAFNHILYKVRK